LPRRAISTLSTRAWLALLAGASLIPLLLALTYLFVAQYAREKESAFFQLQSTSRALLQALDRELAAKAGVARSFSVSRSFKDGDLERVYFQSQEILRSLGLSGSIFLADKQGKIILHTEKPLGFDLPTIVDLEGVNFVFANGQPHFSNYYLSPVTGRAEISVLVPVFIDSKISYVLGLTTPLTELADILKRQRMPNSWLTSIVDRKQVVLARTMNAEKFVGTRTSTAYTEAVTRSPEGTIEGARGAEGNVYLSAWVRSPLSGWTLGMSYDVNEFSTPIYQRMWLIAFVAASAIGLSFIVAWIVARKFDSGTLLLQQAADAMRAEKAVTQRPTGIEEYDRILTDFADASTLLRARSDERKLLLNELNHRVKNSLATVQSIAMQTLRNSPEIGTARRLLDERLVALSKAHDVLTRERWEGASLAKIVENSISIYSGQAGNRFEVEGPDVWVPPNYALAFALALHELCTNAIKYGALSNETGSVRIAWAVAGTNGTRTLRVRWTEIGGPTVSPPKQRGFGTRLVVDGLRQDLAGNVQIDFNPTGVVCEIDAPLNTTSFDANSSRTDENAEQRT
jgi:two-component sensor histidine kinase